MFFLKSLKSESGMGIIQVLAALLIVTASIAGLFTSTYYVRYKADAHYHYRVALLKATQKLEEIKWYNMYNQHSVAIEGNETINTGEFIIDDLSGEPVIGFMTKSKQSFRDLAVANYIAYDMVTIKVTWRNGPERYFYRIINVPQELELREDYFYRTDQVVGASE